MEAERHCVKLGDGQVDQLARQNTQRHALGSIPQATALAVPRRVPSKRLRDDI